MKRSLRMRTALTALLFTFALQACTTMAVPEATIAAPASAAVTPAGPALWKVADEDTTIYLFGTVHALPDGVEWYTGPIETALESADTLVTEIPADATSDPASQQAIAMQAMLPEGKTLRGILGEEQSAKYEAALTGFGLPVNAFDRFEPWFAGMTMAVLPLLKNGWTAESGVENVVETSAGETVARDALETVEYQIGVFDNLPQDTQIEFLMSTIDNIDQLVPLMDEMLAEWVAGDADGLAELMNSSLTDPTLAKALLYDRNANWAEWIDERMDTPGTVFIAVGAGHLAGEKSVQDYLAGREITVTRIQ